MRTMLSEMDLAYSFSSELELCPRTEQEDGFFCALSFPCLVLLNLVAVGIRTGCRCGEENKLKCFRKQNGKSWSEEQEVEMVL